MMNINAFTGELRKILAIFLGEADYLYPPKNQLPEWMPQILRPITYNDKIKLNKNIKFNISENVCGLTINFGYIKRGILCNFLAYDKNGNQIPEIASRFTKIRNALADIQQDYNASDVVLQVKILENKNYYQINENVFAFSLYIDGIEQELKDMAELLRTYNIELVPILDMNVSLDEKTKENYSAQSLLSNVPSKGIICTNRQKSLSFLL